MNVYSTMDGLPSNKLRTVYIDSREIVWIGTENGLSKYQSGFFENFTVADGLSHNSIWAIEEDIYGTIWLGTYGEGVSYFDGKNFHQISTKGLPTEDCILTRKLFFESNVLWVGTADGIYGWDTENEKVITVNGAQFDNELNQVTGFFKSDNRIFYTTYRNGIFELAPDIEGTYSSIQISEIDYIYSVGVVDHHLYLGRKSSLEKWKLTDIINKKPSQPQKISDYTVWDFATNGIDEIYFAAWGIHEPKGGIMRLKNDQVEELAPLSFDLNRKIISVDYHPTFDRVFFGSNEEGLISLNLDDEILRYESNNDQRIIKVRFINSKQNLLKTQSLQIVDPKSKTVTFQITNKEVHHFLRSLPEDQLVNEGPEKDFFELNAHLNSEDILFYDFVVFDNLYYLSTNVGLIVLSSQLNPVNYLAVHTYAFEVNDDGHIVETNPYGGMRIHEKLDGHTYRHFEHTDPNTPTFIVDVEKNGSDIWLASIFNGLFKLDSIGKIEKTPLYTDGKEIEQIKKIHFISPKKLIVGDELGNIYIFEINDSLKHLQTISNTEIEGNNIFFLESYQGNPIIGTEKGINILNEGNVLFFDKDQGLGNSRLEDGVVHDNTLWLAGEGEYFSINLDRVLQDDILFSG
ncbi:MAG: hypothetical protein JJU23_10830, partial [Cyclobacteriaceae bacterium]|nr:hypothetical protein [Cyclobacteriaceae bacterium]